MTTETETQPQWLRLHGDEAFVRGAAKSGRTLKYYYVRKETSYFSTDANCAPKAKLNNPRSDAFEISWCDACGIVEGYNEYAIRNIGY